MKINYVCIDIIIILLTFHIYCYLRHLLNVHVNIAHFYKMS
jgi:hypothetical protein